MERMNQDPQRAEVTWHEHHVTRQQREQLNGHRGCVIWFTGLSGCGKSTVANEVDRQLHERGVHSYLLDGDNVRHALNASPAILAPLGEDYARRFGLGFSPQDRQENIRRVGAVAELFAAAGVVTLAAFVSPYRRDRDLVRAQVEAGGGAGTFVEVFVDTPLEVCEQRDPKGLYRKARAGELKQFTGIDAPYEPPVHPELRLAGGNAPPENLAAEVIEYLDQAGLLDVSTAGPRGTTRDGC
jgi:adenylylsulfate kinase